MDKLIEYLTNFWYNEYMPLKEENKQLKELVKQYENEVKHYRTLASSLSKQKQRLLQQLNKWKEEIKYGRKTTQ